MLVNHTGINYLSICVIHSSFLLRFQFGCQHFGAAKSSPINTHRFLLGHLNLPAYLRNTVVNMWVCDLYKRK